MSSQAQGFVDDLTTWVELRVKLAQIELEEQLDRKANELANGLILAVLGALTGLFALLTLAWFLGWLFGHPAWGFLSVTVLLGLLLLAVRSAKPKLLHIGSQRARVDEGKVSRGQPAPGRDSSARGE